MMSKLEGCLRFVAVSAAWPFELEAAIVGNIYLLIRVINEKRIRADAEASMI
jgi:hypothetical protein